MYSFKVKVNVCSVNSVFSSSFLFPGLVSLFSEWNFFSMVTTTCTHKCVNSHTLTHTMYTDD